ncbi:MAG: ParA family protein, partial [Tepidisphaeraceae bacterium]
LLETVQLVSQRLNPMLKVSGIVLTMFDAQTKLSMEVVSELQGFISAAANQRRPWSGARVFETRIRRNIKLAESPSFGQSILQYEPTSNGASDHRALAREVAGMSEASEQMPPPVIQVSVNTRIDQSRLSAAASPAPTSDEVAA